MSGLVRAVLHFRDGGVLPVTLPGGEAPPTVISATGETGEELEILLSSLKGIFYLKDPRERVADMDLDPHHEPAGPVATIEFEDGEVQRGIVQSFDVGQPGFFLFPAEPHSNNAKIYVVTAAVRSLELRP